jgi:hypothetical protein
MLFRSPKTPFEAFSAERMLNDSLMGGNSGNLIFLESAYKLMGTRVSACLIKIEILNSALPRLLREIARRGIDDASLALTNDSGFGRLDAIAMRCNDVLRTLRKPPLPVVGALDREKIVETAERLARRLLETIGPGNARPTGEKMFPFLPPPKPRYIASLNRSR